MGDGDFNRVHLCPAKGYEFFIIHLVCDVDFDEQQHLVVGIGKDDIGPVKGPLLTRHGHELARLPLEIQAARGIFIHRALVINVHCPHRAGFPQDGYRPVVSLCPTGHYRWYAHPLPLLKHRFGVAVRVGFVLVTAVLIQRAHLVAKMPGLVDVTVAQANGLATAPAAIAAVELVGHIGPHHIAQCIIGKRELYTGSHWVEKYDKEKKWAPVGTFLLKAIYRPNSGLPGIECSKFGTEFSCRFTGPSYFRDLPRF